MTTWTQESRITNTSWAQQLRRGVEETFLLLENDDYMLQEDSFKIQLDGLTEWTNITRN